MKKSKCIVCGTRPQVTEKGYCGNCSSQIAATRNNRAPQPFQYLHWKGIVVGLIRDAAGKIHGEATKRSLEKLPAGKVLNLDAYCPGYTREQIKRLKAGFMAASGLRAR